ncbi:TonB-dependent receptor [Pelagerythrobacter rhizovicinus]|uniref:TonB-dependent receptor n=1 Tax=Pelagerythrobacter rhizovicinus TaxID=2268576 RepID=A0A4Q2KGI8_9SPHN|nr:TonB-dependent receptor [Pelagerythrobacter rhizovicinus]RXZ64175.1 TonB-dependent receptor [Pelagerythrobacter rhizovicinus]
MPHTQSRTRNTRIGVGRKLAAALALGVAGGAMSLAMVAPAHAQESTASLRGRITGVEGVTQVAAIEVNTGIRRISTVGADGSYQFASLRPGIYRLEITTADGVRQTDQFTLLVAQDAVLDFDLAAPQTAPAGGEELPGSTGGEILVTADRIRTMEGGEVGVNITQRLIEQLPQNNRNFLAFADLAPGVMFVTGANGQSRLQGGAQDSSTVNVFIDGVGQKDYVLKNGITGQDSSPGNPFPQLAIGEYRVISSNYKAEFDQVSSVAITAVTKSGTNEFHGEGFFDFTNQDLRDPTPSELYEDDGVKVETKDMQFGGSLGGPIIKDVMHFFVAYEGKRIQRPVDITPGLGREPSFFPEEYRDAFGTTNETFNENLYFGKIDISPSDSDLVEFSVKYRDETGENVAGGINSLSRRSLVNTEELRGTARWEHSADTWVNDLKLTYEDVKWAPTPALFEPSFLFAYAAPRAEDPAETERGNLLHVGGSSNYQNKGQEGWGIQNDFTYTGFDRHTIKAGIKAKWVTLNSLQRNNLNPTYTYNVAFNPGGGITFNDVIPYRVQFGYESGFGESQIESDNFQFGVYIQDDWEVTDRLTLNLGIRWDYEKTPAYLDFAHDQDVVDLVTGQTLDPATGEPLYPNLANANYDINDYISTGSEREPFMGAFQPRVGFSYELDEEARFVLFGGYGRSYDRNQFDFLQQEISVGSFTTRTFNFDTGDPLNECNPSPTCVPWDPIYLTPEGLAQLAESTPGGGSELRFINNDLKMPYSDQFSLGLRTRFEQVELEAGYTHVESKDGFVFLLGNRRPDGSYFQPNPAPGETPQTPWSFSPPGYGNLILGDNGLETSSDSAYLKFTKNYSPSSPWSLSATYTYTEAEENRQYGEVFSLDYPSIEDYPVLTSSGVPRHRFVAAGSVDLPFEAALSAKFTLESPRYMKAFRNLSDPFERTIVGIWQDGNGDRWGRRQMDLAFTKYIPMSFLSDESRVRFRVDIINLFNDRNYTNFNNNPADDTRTESSPTIYGERTGFGVGGNPPRTIKFSAGFSF